VLAIFKQLDYFYPQASNNKEKEVFLRAQLD
jgi:hypothetical protein